jgi:hypothetical protein
MKGAGKFISAITGHKGESLGEILGQMAQRRMQNVEATAEQSHLILLNIGITPEEAPLNVVYPILEGASLEEDPEMRTLWANLLANAADPREKCSIHPSFPGILKGLTSRDAKFLNALYIDWTKRDARIPTKQWTDDDLRQIYADAGLSRSERLGYLSHGDYQAHREEIDLDLAAFAITLEASKPLLEELNKGDFSQSPLRDTPDLRMHRVYTISALGLRSCGRAKLLLRTRSKNLPRHKNVAQNQGMFGGGPRRLGKPHKNSSTPH